MGVAALARGGLGRWLSGDFPFYDDKMGLSATDDPQRRWRRAGLCAVLLCLGALVFGQVRGFAFVTSDDRDLIVGNPLVHSWSSAPLRERLLTPGYGYAIPVTAASFALDAALFGPDVGRWAAGAHVVNLLLHLGNTLLVFAVLLGLCEIGRASCRERVSSPV